MAFPSRRLTLVKDSINVIVRRLLVLPSSSEVEDLRAKAEGCRQEAESWQHAKPSTEERERLMRRVLALHVEVAKLERQRPAT